MATDDSLLREVDDAVRHDRMVALWKKYRTPVLAFAVALVVATGGSSFYREYQQKQAGINMAQLVSAQSDYNASKFADAATKFEKLATNGKRANVRDLARLWQARALEKSGNTEAALKPLAKLAEHPESNDLIWRDLACLRLASLDAKNHTCLGADNSPLASERRLAKAADLWQQGKNDDAAKLLASLAADSSAPESVRQRAAQYQSAVQTDAAK
jgi:hypothetical protein